MAKRKSTQEAERVRPKPLMAEYFCYVFSITTFRLAGYSHVTADQNIEAVGGETKSGEKEVTVRSCDLTIETIGARKLNEATRIGLSQGVG